MLRRVLLSLAAVACVGAGALVLAGHNADRLVVDGRDYDRVELRVNSFTASAQSNISLDMDSNGDVVAAWDSRRQDSGSYGVFARWIDSAGNFRGPEEQLNVERGSMQMNPSVTLGDDGTAWFAWESFGQDGELGAIVSRSAGDERLVNSTTRGNQTEVVTDRLTDGRHVAVWTTFESDPNESQVAVRLSSDDGDFLTEEILLDTPTDCHDRLPSVAATAEGGFVAAWTRVDDCNQLDGIYAARFDSEARLISDPVRVSEPGAPAIEPSVAADDRGCYAIAWMRLDEATDYDVMIRRFDTDGNPLAPETLAMSDPAGPQSGAAIAMAARGEFVVAWNTHSDGGNDSDVFVRRFDADGKPLSGDERVNRVTRGKQALPAATGVKRLALGDDGRLAIAWEGNSGHGDESAANVTLFVPRSGNVFGDLASGFREARSRVASLLPTGRTHLDATATPHVPPSFDASRVSPVLDPESHTSDGRDVGFIGFTNTGWTPPDPHMCAGNDHVMAMVNGGIRAYLKDGTVLWTDDISGGGGFWGELGATSFVFDPEVIWDPYEERFMLMANERGPNSRSYFLLGISSTSDPTDPWHKYRFDVTSPPGGDTDSPNIAVDGDAIYITADFFTGGQKYYIYIIDKSSVIDGGTAVTTDYLHTGSQSFGIPVMYTDDAPTMYMIEHWEYSNAQSVRLWAIQDPLGSPSITSILVDVPAYWPPGDVRSQGTSSWIETFDARFWSCMYRDGSLWAAHHISSQNSPRNCVSRWYEIETNGWPVTDMDPMLKQSGTVDPGEGVYAHFNSIFSGPNGDAMMVFAQSSLSEYFSIQRTYRQAGDPDGFMGAPVSVKESSGAYHSNRWGDYSAIVIDPVDPSMYWMHHEYTPGGSWHTWIASQSGEIVSVEPSLDTGVAGLSIAPSPTSGPTMLTFDLAAPSAVAVEIYDIGGRLVSGLNLGHLPVANHRIAWDGKTNAGTNVTDGVYMVRLIADDQVVGASRLVVVR